MACDWAGESSALPPGRQIGLRIHERLRHTNVVPEFCTCGAELPPDARFCHKCGKPQREELTPEPPPNWQSEPKPTFVTNIPAPPPRPSFRNPAAVRVGFFAACLASLLCTVFAYAFVVWLVAAGFFSV